MLTLECCKQLSLLIQPRQACTYTKISKILIMQTSWVQQGQSIFSPILHLMYFIDFVQFASFENFLFLSNNRSFLQSDKSCSVSIVDLVAVSYAALTLQRGEKPLAFWTRLISNIRNHLLMGFSTWWDAVLCFRCTISLSPRLITGSAIPIKSGGPSDFLRRGFCRYGTNLKFAELSKP